MARSHQVLALVLSHIPTRVAPVRLEFVIFDVLAAQFGFRSRCCCEHEDLIEANRLEDLCRPCGEGRKQTYFVANQVRGFRQASTSTYRTRQCVLLGRPRRCIPCKIKELEERLVGLKSEYML